MVSDVAQNNVAPFTLFPMLIALLLGAASLLPVTCTSAASDCTEWIKPINASTRVLVYRNYSLETKNENITRALIFVHGINRDADNHFRTALAAAFLAGALNDTIIVAPRFASNRAVPGNEGGNCRDALATDEANWICDAQRPDTWRSGRRSWRGQAELFRFYGRDSPSPGPQRDFPQFEDNRCGGSFGWGPIRHSLRNAQPDPRQTGHTGFLRCG